MKRRDSELELTIKKQRRRIVQLNRKIEGKKVIRKTLVKKPHKKVSRRRIIRKIITPKKRITKKITPKKIVTKTETPKKIVTETITPIEKRIMEIKK